ncbi:MAG TPA: SDR family oxidoreductase [Acidimicrobiales bacterium]|jgi:NAD(P)-dependent dehydrogenase (short-subunit alcohol dehydrogenase family)|nr:SDR family oxidoreductase [Acidimicrobiales bacterium]
MTIEGAAALVTGGSQGIGRAIVRQLREAGGRVAVLDLEAREGDGDVALVCDVADEKAVVESVAAATEQLGGLDLAFLNAGVGGLVPLLHMTVEEWDRVHDVNLRGAFVCLRECARAMAVSGIGGSIVVTGSVSGFLTDRHMAHYNSSKAGVAQLARIAAAELGPQGIRVNVIAPGTTATPLFARTDAVPGYRQAVGARTPLGGIGSADDVAAAAVALAQMRWVTGQVLVADGGVSLCSPIDIAELVAAGGRTEPAPGEERP